MLLLLSLAACERDGSAWRRDLAQGNPVERRLAALALRDPAGDELRPTVRALLLALGDGDAEVAEAVRSSLLVLAPHASEEMIAVVLQFPNRRRLRVRMMPFLRAGGPAVVEGLQRVAAEEGPRAAAAARVLEELEEGG